MPSGLFPGTPGYKKRLRTMARLRANGYTMSQISQQVGLCKSSVSKQLSTAEAKQIIDRETNRLLEALPDITSSTIQQIKTSSTIHNAIANNSPLPGTFTKSVSDGDGGERLVPDVAAALKYAEIAGKRERDIMQGMGILPSHAQSVYIQQIYNDNRKTELSPAILAALGANMAGGGLVDEAEVVEDIEEQGGE